MEHFQNYAHLFILNVTLVPVLFIVFSFYIKLRLKKTLEECNIYVLENDIIRNIPTHLHILCIYIVNVELNTNCFNNTILSCVKPQPLTDKTPLTEASRNRDYQK